MNQKKFRELVSKMPPLAHGSPDAAYSAESSKVVQWAMALPGFKEWVWKKVQATGRVVYDRSTGRWHGIHRKHIAHAHLIACPVCRGVGLGFQPDDGSGEGGWWLETDCAACGGSGRATAKGRPLAVNPAASDTGPLVLD